MNHNTTQIVSKRSFIAVHHEGLVVGTFAGPDCEAHAKLFADALDDSQQAEPMFWVRLRSDGGYQGPIHNDGIERARKLSGGWSPLFPGAAPAQQPTDWREAVLDALASTGGDMPATATPAEIVRAVIDAHVQIALDPRVSDAAPAQQPDEPMPEYLRDMITGMSVSVDVSTGEHDAGHRYFGTVTEVMDDSHDKFGVTLLVQDAEPNFKAPSVQASNNVKPVAVVRENLAGNEARIQYLFNPVPVGAELQWDHNDLASVLAEVEARDDAR